MKMRVRNRSKMVLKAVRGDNSFDIGIVYAGTRRRVKYEEFLYAPRCSLPPPLCWRSLRYRYRFEPLVQIGVARRGAGDPWRMAVLGEHLTPLKSWENHC